MLPNFLIIGAMKAGTSSLHRYLRAHPQVFVSKVKETNFFLTAEPTAADWRAYEDLFAGAGDARAVGEASPNYTKHPLFPGVPERIAAALPDVRMIYLVREPLARLRSHYLHSVSRGRHPEETLDDMLARNASEVDATRYATQIERYLEHFEREQLLVLQSERLRTAQQETLARVCRFLGVDPNASSEVLAREFNTTKQRLKRAAVEAGSDDPGQWRRQALARATVSEPMRRRVLAELRPEVRRLYRYVDGDFDGWGIADPPRLWALSRKLRLVSA